MTITNIVLAWALHLSNLGNYKPFSSIEYTIKPLRIAENKSFVFNENNVYTIKTHNATLIGKFKLPSTPTLTPVCSNGVLYYNSQKGDLIAYSVKKSKILWSKELSTTTYSSPIIYKDLLISYEGISKVSAYDTLTGKLVWTYTKDISKDIFINSELAPLISNDLLVIGIKNYLIVLNAITGVPILEKSIPIDTKELITSIKISKNNVFISTNKGTLLNYTLTGYLMWKYTSTYFTFDIRENNIVLLTEDKIIFLNNKGIKEAEYKLKKAFPYDVKLINSAIVIASSKGIKFWDTNKKKITYSYSNNTGIRSLFVENNIVIGASNKSIYYAFNINFTNK